MAKKKEKDPGPGTRKGGFVTYNDTTAPFCVLVPLQQLAKRSGRF